MSAASHDAFAASRAGFEALAGWLGGAEADGLEHAELERRLADDGRELLRQLFQDHLDLRAERERRADVVDAEGDAHTRVEADHGRGLATVFGEVTVRRLAYRRPGHANLHPADGVLNLPAGRHSHGLRRLAAVESSRGSFGEAVEAIERSTGTRVGKRQVEDLARRAASDIDAFYASAGREPAAEGDVVVLSVDGKGIVMRPDSLRPATERAAAQATTKLATRLSKGEKRNRKRLAEVGAVYELTRSPGPRTTCWPPRTARTRPRRHGPRPSGSRPAWSRMHRRW